MSVSSLFGVRGDGFYINPNSISHADESKDYDVTTDWYGNFPNGEVITAGNSYEVGHFVIKQGSTCNSGLLSLNLFIDNPNKQTPSQNSFGVRFINKSNNNSVIQDIFYAINPANQSGYISHVNVPVNPTLFGNATQADIEVGVLMYNNSVSADNCLIVSDQHNIVYFEGHFTQEVPDLKTLLYDVKTGRFYYN
jgi:hypothetical protein